MKPSKRKLGVTGPLIMLSRHRIHRYRSSDISCDQLRPSPRALIGKPTGLKFRLRHTVLEIEARLEISCSQMNSPVTGTKSLFKLLAFEVYLHFVMDISRTGAEFILIPDAKAGDGLRKVARLQIIERDLRRAWEASS